MKPENFDIDELIDDLNGTCQTINEALGKISEDFDENDLTTEDHEAIDAAIFRCGSCDWWCEVHEKSEEGNCDDCKEEEDD